MKGLLLKDFYNTKKAALLVMVIPFLMAIIAYAGFIDDGTETMGFRTFTAIMPAAVSAIFSVSLMMNTLVWDENSNYLLYALTTPIDKKLYLKSKYAYLIITAVCYMLISIIPMMIVLFLTGSFRPDVIGMLAVGMLTGIVIALLMGTCLIAVSMKYTATKASSFIAVFGGIFGCLGGILNNIPEEMKPIIRSWIVWIGAALVILLIITATIMFRKSQKWLEQKEF